MGIIQIAGIRDVEEAAMLVSAGAQRLGIPLRLDYHEADCSEPDAAKIICTIRPPASAFLITYMNRADDILRLCRHIDVGSVQIHGNTPIFELRKLKTLAPDLSVTKSLIVRDNNRPELISSMFALSPYVDAFITDTYDPVTGASGATGKTHDWDISRAIVELSPRPVFLAGGLTPENVRNAVVYVKPAGVDTHTGVEGTDGRKDVRLVKAFVREALQAFFQLNS
jgi:phosphoribosylanthranilate isomerase